MKVERWRRQMGVTGGRGIGWQERDSRRERWGRRKDRMKRRRDGPMEVDGRRQREGEGERER